MKPFFSCGESAPHHEVPSARPRRDREDTSTGIAAMAEHEFIVAMLRMVVALMTL